MKRLAAIAALAGMLLALVPATGSAQVKLPPVGDSSPSPTPSPTPTKRPPSSSPTPTPTQSQEPDPQPSRSSSPAPSPAPKPSTDPGGGSDGGGGGSNGGGSTGGSTGGSGRTRGGSTGGSRSGGSTSSRSAQTSAAPVYDASIQAALREWATRDRSASRTTSRLLELLEQLSTTPGPLTTTEIVRGIGRFPIAGYTWYTDDWGAPRWIPSFHPHEGTDLFAASGTPVIAVSPGRIARLSDGSVSGYAIWLEGDDGYQYFYGHLQRFAPGTRVGARVPQGRVIGYVGASGNAAGTPPHVHFEIKPLGGTTVNPKPILDGWLHDAERRAVALLGGEIAPETSPALGAARWDSLVALLKEPAGMQPMLWPSVLDPASTMVGFADLALGTLTTSVDWDALAASGEGLGASADSGWHQSAATMAADPLVRLGVIAAPPAAEHAD